MIHQHETNLKEDSQAIDELQSRLPSQTSSYKAVKAATNRNQTRLNKSSSRSKPDTLNMANIHTKFNELKAMLDKFQSCNPAINNQNKTRDELYQSVYFIDSNKQKTLIGATRNTTRFFRRIKAKSINNKTFTNQYIKNNFEKLKS